MNDIGFIVIFGLVSLASVGLRAQNVNFVYSAGGDFTAVASAVSFASSSSSSTVNNGAFIVPNLEEQGFPFNDAIQVAGPGNGPPPNGPPPNRPPPNRPPPNRPPPHGPPAHRPPPHGPPAHGPPPHGPPPHGPPPHGPPPHGPPPNHAPPDAFAGNPFLQNAMSPPPPPPPPGGKPKHPPERPMPPGQKKKPPRQAVPPGQNKKAEHGNNGHGNGKGNGHGNGRGNGHGKGNGKGHGNGNGNGKGHGNGNGNGSEKNKNKNKNKPKGKKRVSEIKYQQYLASIFPDADNDGMEEITDFHGRELARPGEFPHMGAIGFINTVFNKTEYKCGASLISNIFAVTSAHCGEFNGNPPTYVRFGDLNLKAAEEDVDPQTRQIAQFIKHPSYTDDSLYNDIALIQLKKPIIFTEFVRPIRLWFEDDLPFTHAFAMGFGSVQFAGAVTNRLTEFNLTIIPNDICKGLLPKQPSANKGVIDSQICAIDYKKSGSDTFQGDSGGPLQVSFEGPRRLHEYLIGITSYGVLGGTRLPGVYTRVSSYVDWIEQTVWRPEFY